MENIKQQIEEHAPAFFSRAVNVLKMYITERCNLDCDFCLYRDRGIEEKNSAEIQELLSFLNIKRVHTLVLSGGEPTLRWDLLSSIITFVRNIGYRGEIIVQTNGILLDNQKLDFFLAHTVSVEFGFDGALSSMQQHRIGITDSNYDIITKNIAKAVEKKVNCWATMVVPPRQADQLVNNFKALLATGLPRVDVSPAIYELWDDTNSKMVKKEFIKLMEYLKKEKKIGCVSNYINKQVKRDELLLVVTADLGVSLNYMNMCVPKQERAKHNFLRLEQSLHPLH